MVTQIVANKEITNVVERVTKAIKTTCAKLQEVQADRQRDYDCAVGKLNTVISDRNETIRDLRGTVTKLRERKWLSSKQLERKIDRFLGEEDIKDPYSDTLYRYVRDVSYSHTDLHLDLLKRENENKLMI